MFLLKKILFSLKFLKVLQIKWQNFKKYNQMKNFGIFKDPTYLNEIKVKIGDSRTI